MGEGKTSPPAEPMPGTGQIGVGFLTTYLSPFEIISVAFAGRADRSGVSGTGQTPAEGGVALMTELGLTPYLMLGAFLFACGLLCIAMQATRSAS